MRTNAFPFRFILCALFALALWSAPAFSQRPERGLEAETEHSNTANSNGNGQRNMPLNHELSDWTHDHMLYPRVGPMDRIIKIQQDPRAIQHWQESIRKDYMRRRRGGEGDRSEHHNRSSMHPDWAIPLGAGSSVGSSLFPSVYPAKWTIDPTATVTGPGDSGSCASDYLVVPVNYTPPAVLAAGQPSIIGLNNLYSGTAGGCNRAPVPGTDDGVSATTLFSYTILGDDGVVQTSPVTSLDGTLIAFVEGAGTGTSGVSHFHVLAWLGGDGTAASRQDAVSGSIALSGFITAGGGGLRSQLTAGSASDLPLNNTDTLSSPFIDYSNDFAYVGDDAGNIYRIIHVFCPTWAPCAADATGLPSLDPSWGSSGVLNIDTASGSATCTGSVSSITVDGESGNIFAGCGDGVLYAFSINGAFVRSLAVGDGNPINGGIVDAPMLDVVNGWVYAEAGSCAGSLGANCTTTGVGLGDPVLVQASMNLSTVNVASLGPGGTSLNVHAGAFNDAYLAGTTASAILYDFAPDSGGGGEFQLYGSTFTSSVGPPAQNMILNGGAPAHSVAITGLGADEVSPVTEFLTTGGEDRIFAGAQAAFSGNIVAFNVSTTFPATSVPESFATYGAGSSGIVVDNSATAFGQANSVYFGVEGSTGTWAASTAYTLGQGIEDNLGGFWTVTTAGISGPGYPFPATEPAIGGTQTDGGVTWTYQGVQYNSVVKLTQGALQ